MPLKRIDIQSWLFSVFCQKNAKSGDYCESLFSHNKLEFCKADDYSLVQKDGCSISHMPDTDDEDRISLEVVIKGEKNGRRKQCRYESDEDKLDELMTSNEKERC